MTRIPSPPFPMLSGDGRLAATLFRDQLTIVSTAEATATVHTVPFEARLVTFSPDGELLAVAGNAQLATARTAPTFVLQARTDNPRAIFRAALGDNGLLVAATSSDSRSSSLRVWEGPQLQSRVAGDGVALGAAAVFHLRLDATRRRVLLAGVSGRSAFTGDGKPFVGLMELDGDEPHLTWRGAGLPFEPHGYLFPLPDGALGVYRDDRFAVLAVAASAEPEVIAEHTLAGLEKTAISPDGNWLAWLEGMGPGARSILRVARLEDLQQPVQCEFEGLAQFPTLAVSNEGEVTVASSERPNRVLLWRGRGTSLTGPSQLEVPAEAEDFSLTD